jgi:hypothetical protein
MGTAETALIVLASVAGFPAFFSLILFVLSKIGGWNTLATRYRMDRPFQGSLWRNQFGFLGSTRYNGALTVGSGMEGLYLAVFFLFRPFHPPLLIPWGEVALGGRKQTLFGHLVEFRLGPEPLASLWLSDSLARQVASAPGAYLRGLDLHDSMAQSPDDPT